MSQNQFKFSTAEKYLSSIALFWIIIGIITDAMGSHALASFLALEELNRLYQPAVRHLFYGGFGALILICLFKIYGKNYFSQSAWMLHSGVFLFSGTLFFIFASKVLMNTNMSFIGMITPFGGLLMISAWIWTFAGIIRK